VRPDFGHFLQANCLVVPSDQRLRQALETVGLGQLATDLSRCAPWQRQLSGGEQQRLSIAWALLYRPHTL
jgi:putative ATP-binding cassette transporter